MEVLVYSKIPRRLKSVRRAQDDHVRLLLCKEITHSCRTSVQLQRLSMRKWIDPGKKRWVVGKISVRQHGRSDKLGLHGCAQ